VQTVGLTWQHSVEVATVLMVGGGGTALSNSRVLRAAGAFARETAMIGVLYALWELVGRISVTGTEGPINGRAGSSDPSATCRCHLSAVCST
jgi:hypothetical protein